MRWIALGQGSKMAGANMFLVYQSSNAENITMSPRTAPGHAPPTLKPEIQLSVLPGTGVRDGFMTANVWCETCLNHEGGLWNRDSTASQWIWAYKIGPPMNSDDISADIDFHDEFGRVVIDLTRTSADPSSREDPFMNPIWDAVRPLGDPEGDNNGALSEKAIIHGCLMAITFVLLMPTFAILVPLSAIVPISVTRVHAPLQGLSLCAAIAGLGLGIKLWLGKGATAAVHPIIGSIVVGYLGFLQPLFGWLQHQHFRRTGGRSVFSSVHRWLGRATIVLGMLNGVLGFLWVKPTTSTPIQTSMIVYITLGAVSILAYVSASIIIPFRATSMRNCKRGVYHGESSAMDESSDCLTRRSDE